MDYIVRPAVEQLKAYKPGRSAAEAMATHGIERAVKLASNENPLPPIQPITDAITAAASSINRYNDHRATELRQKIADWLSSTTAATVEPNQITVGCGSVGLLQQLCLTYLDPDDEAVFPWISFEAYPLVVQLAGARSTRVPLIDQTLDLDAVAAAITDDTKLVFLANPNNPTGTALTVSEIADFADRVRDDVLIVVDEAYNEFTNDLGESLTTLLPRFRNVVITRTFSKAYGLAGLRVGYAVAATEIVTQLDKVLLPFAVNSLGQVAAMAALDNLDAVKYGVEKVITERSRVYESLIATGWPVPPSQTNFVYLAVGADAEKIGYHLESGGVVTRVFPNEGIRVSIGTPDENDLLLARLATTA